MSEVTQILARIEAGDCAATEELFPLVYSQLRELAAARLAQEKPAQTLQATALVHEVYLRLVDGQKAQHWNSRGHFFAAAAEAMRRILVERARSKRSLRRGGSRRRLELQEAFVAHESKMAEILAVDEALCDLEAHDWQAAQLVKLRYFVGMQHQEAAEALGITRRAADRLWRLARTWLFRRLEQARQEEQ